MAKRVRPGDVIELTSPSGKIYLHYLGKHADYGEGVAVCPHEHSGSADVNPQLFRDGYVTFFPLTTAVNQGLASVVGHLPSPGVPKLMRRPGFRSATNVETWIVEDGVSEIVRKQLSDAERKLPIAAIWNLEMLFLRVSEGWRPESEGQ